MRVRDVTYADWKEECEILYQTHFLEILAPRGYSLNIDDEFYQTLENAGALRILVVYDDNMLPIGYSMSIISPDIHDDDALVATTTAFFLAPDHRAGMAGVKLLRVTEAALAAHAPGARWRVGIPIDVERDTGKVLERVGLHAFERVYTKNLAGGSPSD